MTYFCELEVENSVPTKEKYVPTEDEEERIEDCRDNVFYVTIKDEEERTKDCHNIKQG